MEYLNGIGIEVWRRDVDQIEPSPFKQNPKLVVAINNLFGIKQMSDVCNDTESRLALPNRKLNFHEVRKLITISTEAVTASATACVSHIEEVNTIKALAIKKIEHILESINKSAEINVTPKIVVRNQRLWTNCIYDLDRVTLKSFNDAKKTTIVYSEKGDRKRFNTIVFVLTKVHELLMKNLVVTRRELFYQNVTRLASQSNLDVAVRDVCCILEIPPWNLGIVATAKGLVAGPLTMHTRDGTVIDCMTSGGTLIPQDVMGIKEFKSTAKYILVVEKDAIFQKLLDEGALVRLGPVIIITGKGYPDVCTRQLLSRLCKDLRLRALALVDADPHGFEIFLTYKYGSLAQSHISSTLVCSSLQLLGATHVDVMTLSPQEARLTLTELDKRKLRSLLKRPYLDKSSGTALKEELNKMLSSGVKAELEAVAPTAAALCDAYLTTKIIQAEYLG